LLYSPAERLGKLQRMIKELDQVKIMERPNQVSSTRKWNLYLEVLTTHLHAAWTTSKTVKKNNLATIRSSFI